MVVLCKGPQRRVSVLMRVRCVENNNNVIKQFLFLCRVRKKPKSDCSGPLKFASRQVKMEVWLSSGQVKLDPVVLLVDRA